MQFKDLPHADEKRNENQKNTSSHSIGDMTKNLSWYFLKFMAIIYYNICSPYVYT